MPFKIRDQQIVIFTANRNRNRFTEPTSVQIGIGIVCESQNLRIGIGKILVRWELFTNYSQISEIFLSLIYYFNNFFFLTLLYFSLKNLPGKENYCEIYTHSLYISLIKIRYSWILWKIFVKRNFIRQISILATRNNIHEMKLWQIWVGIYSWPKYQQIDLWWIYSQTICKFFVNRELFAELCLRLRIFKDFLTKCIYDWMHHPQPFCDSLWAHIADRCIDVTMMVRPVIRTLRLTQTYLISRDIWYQWSK